MAKILVVEDNKEIQEILSFALQAKGYSVQKCFSGKEAISCLQVYKYDLVILDWMMPEITGLDVLKHYRGRGGKTPVLMLTAKTSVDDKELGLDQGADDYLTKPFEIKEFLARVRALLRRPSGSLAGTTLTAGVLSLDPATCQVTRSGKEIHLRPKLYSLLEFLMRHPNQVFSGEAILERVWTDDSMASSETVRTHIKLLRQAIDGESDTSLVRTIRNRGYMLVKDPSQVDGRDDGAAAEELI